MNAFWPVYCFASLCLKFESPGMLSQVLRNLLLTGKSCSPLWALLQEIIYRCHMVSRQCFTGKVADVMKFLGGLSSIWLLLMAPPLYDPSTGMGFLESVLEFPWTLQHLWSFHLMNYSLKDVLQLCNRLLLTEFPLWSSVTWSEFLKTWSILFPIGCKALC